MLDILNMQSENKASLGSLFLITLVNRTTIICCQPVESLTSHGEDVHVCLVHQNVPHAHGMERTPEATMHQQDLKQQVPAAYNYKYRLQRAKDFTVYLQS